MRRGTTTHLKQERAKSNFGLEADNFMFLLTNLPTKSPTQNIKKLEIGMKNLPDQTSWFGYFGTTSTVSGGKTAIVIQVTIRMVRACHLTIKKLFNEEEKLKPEDS